MTIELLEEWLVKYKFKDWCRHSDGRAVTTADKKERAQEIAKSLGDNKRWHSHARSIDIETLRKLKLEIDDYSNDIERKKLIRDYHDIICQYVERNGKTWAIHTRKYLL